MLPGGYPVLAEYKEIPTTPLFREMCEFSQNYLETNAPALDYYRTRWVRDPLHNWSRRWEYVYVFERIQQFIGESGPDARMLDAGSGLTFFPHFTLSKMPCASIECCDSDPRLCRDALRLAPPASDQVRYSLKDIQNLDYPDASFDLLYCISVMEHCGHPGAILQGFQRIVRPGGRLVLTLDISPDGLAEIPVRLAAQLIQLLQRFSFEPVEDYGRRIGQFQPAQHLSTEFTRQTDPDLLPWAPPRFHWLSCFCMTFERR